MPVDAIGLLLVTLLATFLPGGLVTAAAGLRVPVAVATAPLVTYGLVAATSTLAILVEVPWGPWLLLLEAVLAAAVVGALRRRAQRPRGRRRQQPAERPARGWRDLRHPRRADLALAAGVAGGSLYAAGVLIRGYGDFGNVSQEWDNTFHANATRFISDSGIVDPYGLQFVNDWDSPEFFYPNAFHALAAVVRDLTGAAVPPVLNSATIMIPVLAALGLAVLLREIGAPTVVSATAPVLLAGFTSFPYDVIWRGPLLPYATGLALLPAFLLLVRETLTRPDPRRAVLAGLGGAALFGLQPASALTGAAFALVLLGATAIRRRRDGRGLATVALAGAVAVVVAAPMVLASVRTGASVATAVDWPAVQTPGQAVGDLLFLNHAMDEPQWTFAALIVVGLLTLRSARYMWWWLVCAGLAAWFFVLASSYDSGLAETVTQPWWNDRWRFIAIAVLGLAALAAHGLERLSTGVQGLLSRLEQRSGRPLARPGVAAGLVLAAVFVASGALYQDRNSDLVTETYQEDDYLVQAEEDAFAWLADRVADGETVMNDPADGSAFMYALEGVRPLFGHQVPVEGYELRGEAQRALLERFHCLDSDPVVRQAIDDLDVRYVMVGPTFLRKSFERLPGLRRLYAARQLELVYREGGVSIWEIAGRPEPDRPLWFC